MLVHGMPPMASPTHGPSCCAAKAQIFGSTPCTHLVSQALCLNGLWLHRLAKVQEELARAITEHHTVAAANTSLVQEKAALTEQVAAAEGAIKASSWDVRAECVLAPC